MQSTMSAPEIFTAPAGAMQFEIQRGWNGEPVPEKWINCAWIWVYPAVKSWFKNAKPECDCEVAYPLAADPNMITGGRTRVGNSVYCACVGRIIE